MRNISKLSDAYSVPFVAPLFAEAEREGAAEISKSRCPLPVVFDRDLVILSFERVLMLILHNEERSKSKGESMLWTGTTQVSRNEWVLRALCDHVIASCRYSRLQV